MSPADLAREEALAATVQRQKHLNAMEAKAAVLAALGPVRELVSDYLGMTSFYVDERSNRIYGIDNTTGALTAVSPTEDAHLRELNGLPVV